MCCPGRPYVKEEHGCSVILLDDLSATSDETSSSGSNKTDFLTSGLVSAGGRWVTDVLMVTTTVGMLDWVHGDTSHSWPVVSLSFLLIPGSVGLQEWLFGSLTASAHTDHGSASTDDGLSGSRWKSNSGLLSIIGVTNDDGGGAGRSGE